MNPEGVAHTGILILVDHLAAWQPKFVPCGHLAESLQDTWEMVDVNSLACIFL